MIIQKKKILVCPLNWGLGHAARDVAIIFRLLDLGHDVIIAGDGAALEFLKEEFPENKFHKTNSSYQFINKQDVSEQNITEPDSPKPETFRFHSHVRIRYSRFLPAWLKITLLSPFLLFEILVEHFRLTGLINKIHPDIVISDNRYGMWNRRVRCILITHQLCLRLPRFARFLEYPAYLAMKILIRKFDQCWIPDYPGTQNLSGELSHRFRLPGNAVFIGAVSRFILPPFQVVPAVNNRGGDLIQESDLRPVPLGSKAPAVDLLILLSGPEPQRSILQKNILKQALSFKSSCVILQGIPGKFKRTDLTSTVTMYSHLPSGELKNLIFSAKNVICRSGYTGIMDLALMHKKALLIPTPGQTEQEYLAEYLAGKGMFMACNQDALNLESAIKMLSEFNPEFNLPAKDLLANELARL